MDRSFLEGLTAIVGAANVIAEPGETASYALGARGDKGKAAFVARPANAGQVSQLISYLHDQGVGFIPQGANTGLVGASVPDASGKQGIISLSRLAEPVDVDPINRSVTAGAGVKLSRLNEALAEHGLHFPIDLGADPSVGGMISTNTGGARFIKYGDVRDHVLGLEVVLRNPAGTIIDLCKPLRKNNIGLETSQLFIGTGGAYGLITKAVLNVSRKPTQSAVALIVPRDMAVIAELLIWAEERFGDTLTAFEGMSHNAMMLAIAHVPRLSNPFAPDRLPPYAILVEISRAGAFTTMSLDDILVEELQMLMERPSSPLANALLGQERNLWSLRHALNEGLARAGRVIAFDIAFARGDVVAFRKAAGLYAAKCYPHLMQCDFGHIGDGGMHFNFVEPHDGRRRMTEADIDAFRADIYALAVSQYGGSFSAEHGVGPVNERFYHKHVGHMSRHIAAEIGAIIAAS